MRFLTPLGHLLVCAVAVFALAAIATQSSAHPSATPDHGVNETTSCTLWSGDTDASNVTVLLNRTNESTGMCVLAAGTDIPLDSPPGAVAQWNRGYLRDFPRSNASHSIHPPNATLTDGRFVRDAYTEIFAVQPSTRTRLSPTDQPLYVAPNGTLLGTVDYRVAVPTETRSTDRRVSWNLTRHEIVSTRLLVDGVTESTARGSHTPVLSYELQGTSSDPQTLTLEAEITVELEKRVSTCTTRDIDGGCLNRTVTVTAPTETLTVRETLEVVSYDLTISGYRAQYPNGDLGLVVYKNQPWLGYTLPNGDVRGVWRFYSERDPDWDTLVWSSAHGETVEHSPLHPLQVNAYPIETGPTPSPRRTVTILETYGAETRPPTLPDDVALDVLTEPYTASFGIATRTQTTTHDLSAVTAYGLVHGVEADASAVSFATVSINRSELSVDVLNATAESVTVRVHLQDAATGEPIATANREGYVVLQDQRVNTSANGSVTTTLPRPVGGVSARYEPGRWWSTNTGYVGDSDVVYVRGTFLRVLSTLYEIAVPVSLFLVGVFLIDRITGWRIWPPWRRL